MTTISSQRPWEMDGQPPAPSSSPPPRGQLPSISALTSQIPTSNGLPSPASTRERDSGGWSQPQSTRSSAYSTNTSSYGMSSATNSYYMSPQRMSNLSSTSGIRETSHASADYSIPTSAGALGSPGFSSPHNSSLLPSINQHHDPNRQNSSSDFPAQESRRSSIGSQVNQRMDSLQINGTASPFTASVNHSSTSLAQSMARERGIAGPNGLRNSRSSAQLPQTPLSPESSDGRPSTSTGRSTRVAPPIGHNPRSDIYNAHEPIPGQAYAFPDAPDFEPGALPPKNVSRHMSNTSDQRPSMSRRDSGHSSVFTSDSRLPPGQHRLEDSHMPGTHHHTLQQNQMSNLNDDDESMTAEEGAQPYSRTPALRVSHKMAERKRRSEMKDLFENLRSQIPSNQGSKSSKWEILTKASEYINQLEKTAQSTHAADKQLRIACQDIDNERRQRSALQQENIRLMQELEALRGAQQGQQPPVQPQHAAPQPPQQPSHTQQAPLYPSHYAPPPPPPPPAPMHDPSRSLPPLSSTTAAPSSMQGVQYTNEHR